MSDPTFAGYRLSLQQERIWLQQDGTTRDFWADTELSLEGPLDVTRLQSAVRQAVARHEILRTVFPHQPGMKMPFQVILDSPDFVWKTVDLSNLEGEARDDSIRNSVNELRAVFDIDKGPPLQVLLVRVSPLAHIMVLSLPSLCADLRTMENLSNEVLRAYQGEFDSAEDVMQYADVAEWQQELLAGDESKAGRDYWRGQCRKIDFPALDSVLASLSQNGRADFSPATVVRDIDQKQFESYGGNALRDLLLASWQAFLSRMTGRWSVTVACHFDGRNYAELVNVLGPLAKSLPLTFAPGGENTFRSLLDQVQRDIADVQNWQDSFSWNAAELPHDDEQGPVLPVAFEYVDLSNRQSVDGLRILTLRQEACAEEFRLKLASRRGDGSLRLEFQFDANCLDRPTVERWSGYFLVLLQHAAANPDSAISRLPLLDEGERRKMLVGWNETAADYPRQQCIHSLFESQVARTPDAPAVRYEDDCLTYQQLNTQANQLAHFLRSQGMGAESLVGLCVDRSTNMLVALLAILKAGAAYVPLSAEHPKPRLAQQLISATALITEGKFECLMPSVNGPMILVDRHHEQWSKLPVVNPEPITRPESLVYVIYTSGSTGTPKGVAVRHRNLVNYTSFIQKRLELASCAEPLHFATVSTLGADLGNTCIYPSLVSGGCLHVIGHDVAADGQRFREYLAKYPVDVLKIVPSHLMALLNSGIGREMLPRKYLVLGGEAFPITLMEKIVAAGGTCEVLNHYGPTETTVGSLTLRLNEFNWRDSSAQTIPIGKPIANTRIYVLDTYGEPVPIGVAGELYIAGDGVTAGYIKQPELSRERFVPERLGPDPKAAVYRTGDLVRYLADGNVEFLGRVDDQVKIRGFRIELGEIESILLNHPEVKQAVVLAIADERGEKSLAAYVVGAATADELRSYLRGQLPDYTVPASIVRLPKLPLNANGKIDRQALPRPEDVKDAENEPVAPRMPTEEVVAAIWMEVFKRDNIGVEDDFFEIGGHSLLATQIASRLREHFKISVPVRAVFESPSIAECARRMDAIRRERQGMMLPEIVLERRDGDLPLSYGQERLWVLDQIEPNNPLYNIPRTLRLKGELQVDALERGLNEIVRRHESQRTTFATRNGHPVQVIAPALRLPMVVRDVSSIPEVDREAEARRLAIEESMQPFDLGTGPLVRALLLRLAKEDHILQLTMHHIISDAWSASIFLEELAVLYESFCAGHPSPLPEPKVQYADYAVQERAWLQGEVLDKQLAFWRETLKGVPPLIELPLDRARPAKRTYQGACEMLSVSAETLSALKNLGREEGATLFMVLMTCFQILLSKYSGQEQIVVGTDLANRILPETERMIGFFINLLPVRNDLSGDPTFRELLGRVREHLFEAYGHQEVPFPKIVEAVQPERSSIYNPIVQVLFVMQNAPRAKREFAGLRTERFELPVMTSKFDMAVFVEERSDGLIGYWIYSAELFEQSTIQRMLQHFGNVLQTVISSPAVRLSAISILTAEEIERQTAEKRQRKQSQFERLKSSTPASVALSSETAKSVESGNE